MTSQPDPATGPADTTADFPDCAVVDLDHLGLIRISGPDSRTFLQGQVTNDVNKVTPTRAQLNSYCSPKGRMLGIFWLLQRDEDLYIAMPVERLDATFKRLSMFVLRSQVTLSVASDAFVRTGLAGDCVPDLLPDAPANPWETRTDGGITQLRLPGDRPRFAVFGPADGIAALRERLADRASVAGPDFWSLLDIRAGLPTVFDETAEAFVPQMANLQLLEGVSFTKGCYTGQEVVARMQYLGKLKRRMYRARLDVPTCPARGAELFSPSSESGQGAGRVVDAAPSPDGGYEALVVLQISVADANDARLGAVDGPVVELLDLPYAFANDEG
jgi:folate-binding protein YgfZ